MDYLPADDATVTSGLLDMLWLHPAATAEARGMEAVLAASEEAYCSGNRFVGWLAENAIKNKANRDRILSSNSHDFAAMLRRWAKVWTNGRLSLANLHEDEVRRLSFPAVVVPGNNPLHPEEVSRRAFDLLPNAKWAPLDQRFSAGALRRSGEASGSLLEQLFRVAVIYEEFVSRIDS